MAPTNRASFVGTITVLQETLASGDEHPDYDKPELLTVFSEKEYVVIVPQPAESVNLVSSITMSDVPEPELAVFGIEKSKL